MGTMGLRSNIDHEVILTVFLRQKHKVKKLTVSLAAKDSGKERGKVL